MPFSKHYIVQLGFELWLAPWCGKFAVTDSIEQAKRYSSRAEAEVAADASRQYSPFPDAFVDVLRATEI